MDFNTFSGIEIERAKNKCRYLFNENPNHTMYCGHDAKYLNSLSKYKNNPVANIDFLQMTIEILLKVTTNYKLDLLLASNQSLLLSHHSD